MQGKNPTEHTPDATRETGGESASINTLDPDLANYFLVHGDSHESESLSPRYSANRKPGKSRSQRSEASRRRKNGLKPVSTSSSYSGQTKAQYITEWNEHSMNSTLLSNSWNQDMRHPADPPRPPKEGSEWVWFPQGYWAERELSNFDSSGPNSSKQSPRQKWWSRTPEPITPSPVPTDQNGRSKEITTPLKPTTPKFEIPRIKIGSISRKTSSAEADRRRSSSHKSLLSLQLGGFAFMKQKSADRNSNDIQPLGLYCRTKRNIREILLDRSRMVSESNLDPARPPGLKSRTTVLLEGTSHFLDQKERERAEKRGGAATPHSLASFVSLDGRLRRGFGLAPWHRRTSHESFLSASSSIHRLLMGKTPSATPHQDSKYVGPNGELFQKVDISSTDPREPSYLPSEARRINTPPMEPGTPVMHARGFFFDLGSAQGSTESASENGNSNKSHQGHQSPQSGATGSNKGRSKQVSLKAESQGPSRPSSPNPLEWWEADTKHSAKGNKSTSNRPKTPNRTLPNSLPSSFVLELPEHLPNSAMCPKNTMHKGGGTGICPSHGRRRSVRLKTLKRIETEESRGSSV